MRLFKAKDDVADPFTLITEKGDVYGFSFYPFKPTGVGIFSHHEPHRKRLLKDYERSDNQQEITFGDLPTEQAQIFVENRVSMSEFYHQRYREDSL